MAKITNFELRQKLKFLQEQINNGCSIDCILDQLSGDRGLASNLPFLCFDMKNDVIFRSRINLDGKLFEKVSDVSYPPSFVATKGRCNREGFSILYASTSPLGTIVENISAGMSVNTLFTTSSIKRKLPNNQLIFKPFGLFQEKERKNNRYLSEINNFCRHEFSKTINKSKKSESDYNFTIAMSEYF